MYRKPQYFTTTISTTEEREEGETIEMKMDRVLTNGEPIKDGAAKIYTKRSDGVNPAHNIRTDRFEIAADAMDNVNKSRIAMRDNIVPLETKKDKEAEA